MSETVVETEKAEAPKVKAGAVAPGGELNGIMSEFNFSEETNGGRGFIVDCLATGPEGAVKLQFLVPREPTGFWLSGKAPAAAAYYHLAFGVQPKNVQPTVKPR